MDNQKLREVSENMHLRLRKHQLTVKNAFARGAEILGGLPFTRGNELKLLIDGKETYKAGFDAIGSAREYVLVNFYMVKNDRVGNRLKEALIERARAGVRVYFLFDEMGSVKLSRRFLEELGQAGVRRPVELHGGLAGAGLQ